MPAISPAQQDNANRGVYRKVCKGGVDLGKCLGIQCIKHPRAVERDNGNRGALVDVNVGVFHATTRLAEG